MRSDSERLNDILTAVAEIKERHTHSLEAFQGDELIQVWVIHHLQVIGEAARSCLNPSRTGILRYLGHRLSLYATSWYMSTSDSIWSKSG